MLVNGADLLPICSVHMPDLGVYLLGCLASPTELTDQYQDEGSSIAEYSFLHTPHPRQNRLKWVPIFEPVHEGTGLKVIDPFHLDKNNWMDIMLVQY